jgi:rod shape-determining protein MreD
MRTAGVLGALALAIVLQTTLSGLSMAGGTRVNLVLVAVVYVALAYGPATGLLAGAAGGLAQDALAGGIVGIGGLSKTVVGFLVGVLGAQFIVSQPIPRFVMFVGATLVHEACVQAVSAVVESRAFTMQYSVTLMQAIVNATVGIVAFQVVENVPGLLQRRDSRRAMFSRRRY